MKLLYSILPIVLLAVSPPPLLSSLLLQVGRRAQGKVQAGAASECCEDGKGAPELCAALEYLDAEDKATVLAELGPDCEGINNLIPEEEGPLPTSLSLPPRSPPIHSPLPRPSPRVK